MESNVNPNFHRDHQTDEHLLKLTKIAKKDGTLSAPNAIIAAIPGRIHPGGDPKYHYIVRAKVKGKSLLCYTTKRGLSGAELPRIDTTSNQFPFDKLRREHFLGRFYNRNGKFAVVVALRDLLGLDPIRSRAHKHRKLSSASSPSRGYNYPASFPNLPIPPTPESPDDSSVNDDLPLRDTRSRMNIRTITESVLDDQPFSPTRTLMNRTVEESPDPQILGSRSIGPFSFPIPARPDEGPPQRFQAKLEDPETPNAPQPSHKPMFLDMVSQQKFPRPLHFWLEFCDKTYFLNVQSVESMDSLFETIEEALGDNLNTESCLSSNFSVDSQHEVFPTGPVFVNRKNQRGLQAIFDVISTFNWSKVDQVYPSGTCQVTLAVTLDEVEGVE